MENMAGNAELRQVKDELFKLANRLSDLQQSTNNAGEYHY